MVKDEKNPLIKYKGQWMTLKQRNYISNLEQQGAREYTGTSSASYYISHWLSVLKQVRKDEEYAIDTFFGSLASLLMETQEELGFTRKQMIDYLDIQPYAYDRLVGAMDSSVSTAPPTKEIVKVISNLGGILLVLPKKYSNVPVLEGNRLVASIMENKEV